MLHSASDKLTRIRESIPVHVHDTAYIDAPMPLALSRATLHPWSPNYHSATPEMFTQTATPASMRDAITRAKAAAPDFRHGLLIHAIQYRMDGQPEPPVISTLRQYASRHTDLGTLLLERPNLSTQQYLLVIELAPSRVVPKWLWYSLAGQLLCPAKTVGDPPPR